MRKHFILFCWLAAGFFAAYHLPVEAARFQGAIIEALRLTRWYAREHVLLCLVPAFFIAGAIGVFVSRNAIMKYFGAGANKLLAYGVASVSGTMLAVCSCTVLPIFGSIYKRGAGLGPAVAFLYSGPAINVLAIVMTARVLGAPLGFARAIGAIIFCTVIGVLMHLIFRNEEHAKTTEAEEQHRFDEQDEPMRPLWQTALYFLSMAGVLVFANWAPPAKNTQTELWSAIFEAKWLLTSTFATLMLLALWRFLGVKLSHLLLAAAAIAGATLLAPDTPVVPFTTGFAALALIMFFSTSELKEWGRRTWGFARQIAPLLLAGVLAAGFFLGGPETADSGIIPSRWIQALVGNRPPTRWHGSLAIIWPLWTNFFASIIGALMYFATLTEVPIIEGLINSGMGQGPALALLLAGPALSLPNMLVINSILGPRKTLTFVALVVVMATISGMIFGAVMGG